MSGKITRCSWVRQCNQTFLDPGRATRTTFYLWQIRILYYRQINPIKEILDFDELVLLLIMFFKLGAVFERLSAF